MKLTKTELADIERRFEAFDHSAATVYEKGDELPPDVILTQALARRAYFRAQADQAIQDAVTQCRQRGLSWHKIGLQLGVTGEAVRQRYAAA